MPSTIMEHFEGEPRPEQAQVLLELERAWRSADVFVIRAPVGAGKSRIGHCIASWAGGGSLITPTNALVEQYRQTWPGLGWVDHRASYPTERAWSDAKSRLRVAPVRVLNYYSYLAHRAYAPVVIVDEAHRLVPMLQEMEAVKLWSNQYPLPAHVRTLDQLHAWCHRYPEDKRLAKLAGKLGQHPDTYTVEHSVGVWRGREMPVLKLLPLTPRHNRPVLWPPSRVRKLVFMSATFHQEDLYDLGLETRRVRIIDCGSPIPAECRPVVYRPVGSLGRASRGTSVPALAGELAQLLDQHATTRGVIHATYDLASQLRATELGRHPRLAWHGPTNAGRVYGDWLQRGAVNGDASVLVASGMTEGLDLHGDRARWQAVCKIQYPNLGDPAVLAKFRQRPEWFAWMAARDVQQAVGRVSRGPTDYGVSYVLDSDFAMLYNRHEAMFSPSFREALHTWTL